jgi:hypothetical protein
MRAALSFVAGLGLLAAPGAHADSSSRPSQPVCAESAHFVVHCDGSAPASMPAQAINDFEDAYGRQVAGGGLSPNAGLRAPIPDDDGKTDVYLMAPPSRPEFSGGIVFRDPTHASGGGQAAYVFMTPDLEPDDFRFRAAHEFMHVIQRAYYGQYGTIFDESLANWGAEWALPDINPLDNNFRHPQTPLDCAYGDWAGTACGNGYWQWLFFQRQVEDFGGEFVASLLERGRSHPLSGNFGPDALREELAARTGLPEDQALRARFADYARKVWDPTAWQTTAVSEIFDRFGTPSANEFGLGAATDTGIQTANVDHLAARYVRVNAAEPRPGDQVRITVAVPDGLLSEPVLLVGGDARSSRQTVPLTQDGAGAYSAVLPFGPLDPTDIVIPLVNDTEDADGLTFSWRAELLRATRAGVTIPRQRLSSVLKKGLRLSVSCPAACSMKLRAVIGRKLAKRLGLARKSKGPAVTIGELTKTGRTGDNELRLKFSRKARGALGDVKRLRLGIEGSIRANGASTAVREKLTLG